MDWIAKMFQQRMFFLRKLMNVCPDTGAKQAATLD